ncbi:MULTISPECIES: MCE family protein [Nocardia]|uniref:MCE family protein n=1 Tax=Nocardia jiangxiensis TaxID=282685 RepID=A0ABW6SCP8_9NOCA|nr:MCE family protein [Nocardia miyunensis]
MTSQKSNHKKTHTVRTGLIGILVVIALVVVAVGFDTISSWFGSSTTYSAYFGDTGGIVLGDKVFLAGVQVGTVKNIDIDGDKVLMKFDVDGPALGNDTQVAIKTLTVLGRKSLQITSRGNSKQPADRPIPIERTRTPYLLTDALGDLTTTVSNLDLGQVTDALGTLSRTLDQTAPNLGAALDGVGRLSNSVASRDKMVQDLFHNAESLTKVLGGRSDQINKLLLDSNTLFEALNQRRQAIQTLLTNLSSVTSNIAALIDDNQQQLRPVLQQLNSVTDLLNRRKDDLAKAILPASQYITSLGESVASGPFFKAYIMNLLPGQYLQPFIDAAFKNAGLDPRPLNAPQAAPAPASSAAQTPARVPSPAPALPGLPSLPGLPPLPGLGG